MLIAPVALVVILVLWFIATQRELIRLDEMCKNALSQIEVQLNSRWDALLNLIGAAREMVGIESKTLIETIKARRGSEVRTAADVNAQQGSFAEVMSRLMVVTEAYPEIKSTPLYQSLMNDINGYEDKVRMSRMVYNDSATKFNRYVRQIPSNFVASLLHFTTVEYIKIDHEEKRERPDLFKGQKVPFSEENAG